MNAKMRIDYYKDKNINNKQQNFESGIDNCYSYLIKIIRVVFTFVSYFFVNIKRYFFNPIKLFSKRSTMKARTMNPII